MNILIFNLRLDADDGVLGFTTDWVNALAERCDQVIVITMDMGTLRLAPNVTAFSAGLEKGHGKALRLIAFYRLLWMVLRKHRIDACFAHMNFHFALFGAPLLKRFRVPILLWYAHKTITPALRASAKVVDAIVTSSPTGFQLPSGKVTIIGQGIDTDRFSPADLTRHQDPFGSAAPLRLLSLGRISRIKRLELILQALARLRAAEPRLAFQCEIVGDPLNDDGRAYLAELQKQAKALGLIDRVTFMPGVPFRQAHEIFRRADIFLNPGDTDSVDKTGLEALSSGLPMITSNVAFLDILPADMQSSSIVPKDDPGALADAISAMAAWPPAKRREFALRGRAMVVAHHSLGGLADRLIAIMSRLARPRPKLLFVGADGKFFIQHRLNLAVAATGQGFDVAVACPDAPKLADILGTQISHIPLRVSRGSTNPFRELATLAGIVRSIQKFRPDVVHLLTSKPILYGGWWCRLRSIPTISAVTGLGHIFISSGLRARFLKPLVSHGYSVALNGPHARVVFENADDEAAFRRTHMVRHDRTTIVPGSGVDLDRIRATPFPEGPTVVALPARMIGEKGVREFAQAARLLKRELTDARFVLYGEPDPGNPTSLTVEELERLNGEGFVEWRGFADDIGAALAGSHIVVLPSYREGFPKTLVDAAAAGRPTVTTDVPGCRDAIIDGETGFLCAPRDAADLARVLRPLIADRSLQERMGAAGRRLAEARFDVSSVTAQHLSLYAAAVGFPSTKPMSA